MSNKELEELIYEYGETMKHIGKSETNEKVGMKEYTKLVLQKETILKKFDEHFNTNSKLLKALNVI